MILIIFSIKNDVFLCVICIIVGRSFGAIRKQYDILRIYRLSVLSQQRAQLDVCDYVTSKKTEDRSVSFRKKAKQQVRLIMRREYILLLFILEQSLCMHYSLWKIPGNPFVQQHNNGLNQTDESLSSLDKIALDQHFTRKQEVRRQHGRHHGSFYHQPQMGASQDILTKRHDSYYMEKLQMLLNNYRRTPNQPMDRKNNWRRARFSGFWTNYLARH